MSKEQDNNSTTPPEEQQAKETSVSEKKEVRPRHTKTQHTSHKKSARKHKTSSWGIVILVLLGLIALAAWYGHNELNKTRKTFSDIQQSQVALTEQNRELEARLLARMQAMQVQQQELTDYIQVLRDKNQHLRKDWLLMEAEYLIQLSNYRLLFERDVNTAIAALESADVRLRDTGDPSILSVRKVIAESIQALRQVPQADLAGLSLTLSAVNKNIEKMPLNTPDPKSKKQEEQSQADQQTKHVKSWSELPAAVWSDLKGLVEIRDHEAPIQPLLSPEERFFLIENVRLQIEQARLAMLSGQPEVFQERLATAISWIEEHFDKESRVTTSTLETLQQVKSESIAPQLPDISATYEALRSYRLGREPAAPPLKGEPISSQPDSQPEQATEPAAEATPSEPANSAKPAAGAN